MNPKDLFRELNLIDDDLIIEAETIKKPSSHSNIWRDVAFAACIAFLIIGSMFITSLKEDNHTSPNIEEIAKLCESTINSSNDQYALILNKADKYSEDKIYIEGHFWESLNEMELKAIFPTLAEKYTLSATANYSGDGSLFNIDANLITAEGTNIYIQLAPGDPVLDYSFNIEPTLSYISNIPILAGYFTFDDETTYFGNFKLDEVGYYIEFSGGKAEKALFPAIIDEIISGGAGDFSVLTPEIPELRDDELSLKEAYEDIDFGAYLPKSVPAGFFFETSSRFINQENDYLLSIWLKGMSDIRWMVSHFSESDSPKITSIGDKENYDLSLYPIPRYYSVPSELSEIVDNPIFLIDELTLDAVMARAYMINDAGDESGYRMKFSVLYNDGILVEVTSKGADPNYIFEQLLLLKEQ